MVNAAHSIIKLVPRIVDGTRLGWAAKVARKENMAPAKCRNQVHWQIRSLPRPMVNRCPADWHIDHMALCVERTIAAFKTYPS